jgi:hypothetical protein
MVQLWKFAEPVKKKESYWGKEAISLMNEDISTKRNERDRRTRKESSDITVFEVSLAQIRFMAENKTRNNVMTSANERYIWGSDSVQAQAFTIPKL